MFGISKARWKGRYSETFLLWASASSTRRTAFVCFICSSCPITASITRDAVRCYIIRDVSTSLRCEQNRILYAGQRVATACAPVICIRSQRVSWTLLVPHRILGRRSWQTCLPAAMLLKIDRTAREVHTWILPTWERLFTVYIVLILQPAVVLVKM